MKVNIKDYLKEIIIKDLFGYYTYEVPSKQLEIHNQLMIIYGDNGSGKTTILELIFCLLSFNQNRKQNIRKLSLLKFSSIKLTLESNHTIIATKKNIKDLNFSITIENGSQIIATANFNSLEEEKKSSLTKKTKDARKKLIKSIKKLNITIFYLSDDRKFSFSGNNEEYFYDSYFYQKQNFQGIHRRTLLNHGTQTQLKEPNILLSLAVKRLEFWIRKKALQGSRQGEKSTNTIYKEIVKRITKSSEEDILDQKRIATIQEDLQYISEESTKYSKYGLISPIELKEISSAIAKSKSSTLRVLYSAIEPYIKGLKANLESLSEVQKVIRSFINQINSYLTHKKISYHLSSGFKITYKDTNDIIDLSNLSSGERQLLLLTCNVITASEEATIFIIDEPEISLNVKWQRELLQTLIDFGTNRNIQFIVATHSIELLTSHSQTVSKLENLKGLK